VRSEVNRAKETVLLRLREKGEINDKTYIDLQLDLDRQAANRSRPIEA
jgi:hypothetical protein